MQDPIVGNAPPDLQELRAAVDHAPRLVGHFLQLYHSHRTTLEKMMQLGSERMPDGLLASSPETIIHDFFRDHANHFAELEARSEKHTSELQSLMRISYAVFCLKQKTPLQQPSTPTQPHPTNPTDKTY